MKVTLPKKVHLAAVKKQWKISYVKVPGKLIIIEHPHRQLTIYGQKHSKIAVLNLITRWVRLKAHHYLIGLLKKCNRKVKVKYKKVIIRSHEAQFVSYSSSKTISLNYKLIFLPPPLVKHVIYHELCHVIHMDHSERFWKEVSRFDRKWKMHRESLDLADSYIPKWVIF